MMMMTLPCTAGCCAAVGFEQWLHQCVMMVAVSCPRQSACAAAGCNHQVSWCLVQCGQAGAAGRQLYQQEQE